MVPEPLDQIPPEQEIASVTADGPASCSFKMPMIWSSVKLLRFISGPFGWARVYLKLN